MNLLPTFQHFERSPTRRVRAGGAAHLAMIALGAFGELFLRGSLVVPGNAAATAQAISAAPSLWRASIPADLLMHVLDVPLIVVLCPLLLSRPVSTEWSLLAVGLHGQGFAIGLVFFALTCLVQGALLSRSARVPRALGRLLQVAGLAHFINSVAVLLAPGWAGQTFAVLMPLAFVGEMSLCLWLLPRSIDTAAWRRLNEPLAFFRPPTLS